VGADQVTLNLTSAQIKRQSQPWTKAPADLASYRRA
jgi:hypothetical protein